jgi:hypothetical protein
MRMDFCHPRIALQLHHTAFSCRLWMLKRRAAFQVDGLPLRNSIAGRCSDCRHYLLSLVAQVSSQTNHDRASHCPLAPPEGGRRSNTFPERPCQENDYQIRGCVQRHGNRTQRHELQEDVSGTPIYELRNEGKKK